MTTIVWRNDTLAADMQVTDGSVKMSSSKIHILETALIGWCGNMYSAMAFIRWYENKNNDKASPTYMDSLTSNVSDDDQFECIVVTHDKIELYDSKLVPIDATKWDYVALGSGAPVALGAMYMKATAIQAVRAAIKHDAQTGYKVEFKTREDIPLKKPKRVKLTNK
jgi:20S proteasome alpha/beta subunit